MDGHLHPVIVIFVVQIDLRKGVTKGMSWLKLVIQKQPLKYKLIFLLLEMLKTFNLNELLHLIFQMFFFSAGKRNS
jgi:hypothetical protein